MNRRAPGLIGIALLAVLLSATACGDSDATRTPPGSTDTSAAASRSATSTTGASQPIPFTLTPGKRPDPHPLPVASRLPAWEDVPDAITAVSLPEPGVTILQSGGTTLAVDTASGVVRIIAELPPEVPSERYHNVQFAPSPDGTRFAFACDDGAAWTHFRAANLCIAAPGVPATIVASVSALAPTAAIKRESGNGVTLVWSPDGRRIAFQAYVETGTPQREDSRAQIYVTDLDSGFTALIVENERAGYAIIRWSPDSQRLALLSDSNGFGYTSIVIIDAESHETLRVGANVPYLIAIAPGFDWSPDSAAIAFVAASGKEPGAASLYVADLNDGAVTHLLATLVRHAAVWSPDGTWIAVTRYLGQRSQFDLITQVYAVRSDGSDARALSDQLAGSGWPYAWAPDNEHLVARGSRTSETGLYLIDINGTAPVLVPADVRGPSSSYAEYTFWSRDRRRLHYTQGGRCMKGGCVPGQLFVLDIATNTPTKLHDALIDPSLHPPR